MPPCLTLSIIRYGSREKSSTLPLHFGVVVIEKKAFGSPSTIYIIHTHTHTRPVKMFVNGLGVWGSIPGGVIPKTQKKKEKKKKALDASLLNTQHYKVWIKGKVEQG